jgi:hypothetical protein
MRRRYLLSQAVSLMQGGLSWLGGRVYEGTPSPEQPNDLVLLYHPSDPTRWVDVPASLVREVHDSTELPWNPEVSGPPPE